MAAIGYADTTGKTGVCIATSGPCNNLITGLADAVGIPSLLLSPVRYPHRLSLSATFQEWIFWVVVSLHQHSFLVQSLEELPRIMAERLTSPALVVWSVWSIFKISVSQRSGTVVHHC